jgi:hypothetical protein
MFCLPSMTLMARLFRCLSIFTPSHAFPKRAFDIDFESCVICFNFWPIFPHSELFFRSQALPGLGLCFLPLVVAEFEGPTHRSLLWHSSPRVQYVSYNIAELFQKKWCVWKQF